MKMDLHCHTSFSDSSFSVEKVIEQAQKNGVTHLAITDHDTTAGIELAQKIGQAKGVEIIPGIEISGYDYKRERRAHILGLYITPGHEALTELCEPYVEARHNASYEIVTRLMDKGYKMTWEEVEELAAAGNGVYKQHIMHALIKQRYTNEIYGELYRKLFFKGSRNQEPGLAHVKIPYIDAVKAIQAIRKAGGIPILAHPGQYLSFEALPEWVEEGLAGVEVWHPIHSVDDERQAEELANKYSLIKTGGSDCHGFYGDEDVPVGSFFVTEEILQELYKHKE
ncbi:PHP domain-containing protein [Bacillus horti]|uniref:Metal-dependent phosphoesterase TrpH n=1 Tax=Caldalkalibacillus horti TaxID=77523 RepID=A0ABT9W1Q6_9BACI|nr:PHP domain-containing protein [Bacillus horti]MDQ0167045.1 putative metal-dependent phosphoesterase TrpH [Bacillus horti]